MYKILFFLISIFLISCKSYQKIGGKNSDYIPYYLKVYEADSLFTLKDYQGSYKILDDLFKKYDAKNTVSFYEYGTYLASCLMTGNTENIDIKVRKSYRDFGVLVVLVVCGVFVIRFCVAMSNVPHFLSSSLFVLFLPFVIPVIT